MAIIKERIENLEAKFMELQYRFPIVDVGVANKPVKIEETINKLSKALLFNLVGKASNNPMLVSFKCYSQSVEKESHNNFEGGLPLFNSQLVKLEFLYFVGMIQRFGPLKWSNFSAIKSPHILKKSP